MLGKEGAGETIAFRWVFGEMDDERNFLPQYIKQPRRFVSQIEESKCQALGLSLFNSQEEAQARFEKLKRRMLDRVYGLGTHLAKGKLQKDFGVSNLPDEEGHFTFHPMEKVVLKHHFETIAPF